MVAAAGSPRLGGLCGRARLRCLFCLPFLKHLDPSPWISANLGEVVQVSVPAVLNEIANNGVAKFCHLRRKYGPRASKDYDAFAPGQRLARGAVPPTNNGCGSNQVTVWESPAMRQVVLGSWSHRCEVMLHRSESNFCAVSSTIIC